MARVELSSRAEEWLNNADPDAHEQVTGKLREAADFPSHFLSSLSGRSVYKLRAGDYRCLIDWRREDDVLFVQEIGHRRNIYD